MSTPSLVLTPEQRRTLETVIDPGAPRPVPEGLVDRLRARIEEGLGTTTTAGGTWVDKGRIAALDRCDGLFVAKVLKEGPPFTENLRTAIGKVVHRAIREDVSVGPSDRLDDVATICRSAVSAILDTDREQAFRDFWHGSDTAVQDEVLRASERMLEVFRATFPPLRRMRTELAPATEPKLKADFLGGNVQLLGYPDLVLGRLEPGRSSRVVIDHKTGAAYASQIDEVRFYALLHALGTKLEVPPIRVATYLAEGGTFQVEEVTEERLLHTADRAAAAGRRAIEVLEGDDVRSLNPGPWCGWCPRATSCPQASEEALAARASGGAAELDDA